MSISLFENHKSALAFAGVVLVGTAIFAESQSGRDNSDRSGSQPEVIAESEPKRATESTDSAEDGLTDEELAEAGWATDDDLIDDAAGFTTDPDVETTPDVSTQPDSEQDAEVVVETSRSSKSRSATSRTGINVGSSASDGGTVISLGPNARVGNGNESDTE